MPPRGPRETSVRVPRSTRAACGRAPALDLALGLPLLPVARAAPGRALVGRALAGLANVRAGGASLQTRLTRAGLTSPDAPGARLLLRAGRASVQVCAGLLKCASPQALRTRAIGASPLLA